MKTISTFPKLVIFAFALFAIMAYSSLVNAQVITGEMKVWHPTVLTFDGPQTSESATVNPFLNYRMTVTFTKGAKVYAVPGYFAADGDAGNSSADAGTKWRAVFCADEPGTWQYSVSFRQGTNVAISLMATDGTAVSGIDGISGSINITPSDKTGSDFRARGMLKYNGSHYLQFAGDSSYFLKGGADSPENILGYFEFDNTKNYGSNGDEVATIDSLHHFEPHAVDYVAVDAESYTWKGGKGKNILGLMNYLSSAKLNSVYLLTYNVDGGDGRDTYPWTNGATERLRYDCSKLDQWDRLFSYMDKKGLQIHVVLTEAENCKKLDGGDVFGTQRKLYYRELIARFGHHLAVEWNIGEEVSNSNANLKSFATYLKAVDPYKHPVAVHTMMNKVIERYDALKGHPDLDATSIQGKAADYNTWAAQIRELSAAAGHPMVVFGDENSPALLPDMSNVATLRKDGLWGNLMGGGSGCEWYFGYKLGFGDINTEDLHQAEKMWQSTFPALDFFQNYLPFTKMMPANALLSGVTTPTNGYCFAQNGQVYAVYLKNGGTANLDLSLYPGRTFTVKWFNPRTGGVLQPGSVSTVQGGAIVALGTPPADATLDWAILVKVKDGTSTESNPPSVPQNLAASEPTASSVVLTWHASTDDSGVAGYLIFRNGTQINSSVSTTFTDKGLAANTEYLYTVKAVDVNGNYSELSAPVAAKTAPSSDNAITSLTLINADTDLPVPGFDPMADNDSIVFTKLGTKNLNVAANVSGAVGSVKFVLDDITVRTEGVAPYALGGDASGNYAAWTPSVGIHVLQVYAYTGSGASGTQIGLVTITFYVLNDLTDGVKAMNADAWTIAPMPFSQSFVVNHLSACTKQLSLIDLMGHTVVQQKVTAGSAIFGNLESLPKGVYFVVDKENNITRKIVK